MLIECPKCGFSQPKDAYCAKCGVNMSAFQSAPLPLVTRLFANPILHITVISFLVVAGTLYIIRQQKKQEITRRMEYLRGGPVYTDASGGRAKNEEVTLSSTEESLQTEPNPSKYEVPPPPPPPTGGARPLGNPENSGAQASGFASGQRALATMAAAEGSDRSRSNKEIKLKAHYLLVPKNSLNRYIQEAQTLPGFIDFGEVKMGSLRSASALLAAGDSLEVVEKSVEIEGPEIFWNVGGPVLEEQPGITTKISIRARENQSLRGEVEMLKAFFEGRDRSYPPNLKAFGPVQFEVQNRGALFLTMVLPTVEQSSSTSTGGFMRLFKMTDFLQRQSEFVLVLEFE